MPGWLGGEDVFEDAEAVYFYLDAVSGLDGAYAGWGSGGDEVAGFEGHGGGYVAEQVGDGEDEVGGGAVLLDDAVEAGGYGDGGSGDGVDLVWTLYGDDGADGAEGVEALAAGPLAVALLEVAGGDVVDADVAADEGADVLGGAQVAAAAADDDAELALVVDAAGEGGHADDAVGSEEGGWGLEEEEGLFGDLVAELGGVVAVVAADAEDL